MLGLRGTCRLAQVVGESLDQLRATAGGEKIGLLQPKT